MAKFKEGDIIDVPMRVEKVWGGVYFLKNLDDCPAGASIFESFVDAHARPSDYGKAQSESLPAETPIAVGDVVRLHSSNWPRFMVDTVEDGKASIFVVHGAPNKDLRFYRLEGIPLACLKKDSD